MMAAKFSPEIPKSKRVNNPIVPCRLKPETVDEFYALCQKAGLSPSNLAGQMIAFALENMK